MIPIPWTVTATVARDAWFSSPESPVGIVVSTSEEDDDEECDIRVMSEACTAAQEAGNNTKLLVAVHNLRGDWYSMLELCEGVEVKVAPFASLSILRALYAKADFAIFPCACQRSPSVTAMAALHAGLPIVCRDDPAFTDIVTPLHDAIIVPNGLHRHHHHSFDRTHKRTSNEASLNILPPQQIARCGTPPHTTDTLVAAAIDNRLTSNHPFAARENES